MALVRFRTILICLLLAALCACTNSGKPAPASPKQNPSDQYAEKAPQNPDPSVVSNPPTSPVDTRPLIVAFGDSLSAGFGADPGKSYPDYLQKLIDQDQKNYRVYNAGVSGDTTTDGLERLPGILTLHAKVVILELGGNDGLRGLPIAATKGNLDRMIVALQGVGAKVILAGMTLPRNYGADYIHQFEQIYVDLANQHRLTRIPFLLDGVAGVTSLMQQDSIHPTAEGNKKVAQTVYRYLKPALTASVR